jgi:hypothetical protein
MAAQHKLRRVFMDSPEIAGEFGALSYLGLVAAAAIGVDVGRLLDRAEHVVHDCVPLIQPSDNAGAWFGAILAEAALAKRTVTVLCPPELAKFGAWAAKIAGRAGVKAEASEATSGERLYVYEQLGHAPDGQVERLKADGQPVVTFRLRDRFDLGQEFFRWEFATAVAAAILGANAFQAPAQH